MPKWTKEQEEAIYKDNTNIIVSAGAGSGKTAVLTERVLEKVKNGISLSNLLILTFTKMAASEMKERIGIKLKENGLTSEIELLDTADITTFDAYALSLVKKYHYYLNISKDINIIDNSVMTIYKKKVLEEIFNNKYDNNDLEFLSLIDDYSAKDDKEIFNYILTLKEKLDLRLDKTAYLDNYLDNNFSDEIIDKNIKVYLELIFDNIAKIREYIDYIDDSNYVDKLYLALEGLLNSNSYEEVLNNLNFKMPTLRNTTDTTKEYKDKIAGLIKEIKDLCIYNNESEMKEEILSTKNNTKVIIDIIREFDKRVEEYKKEYDYYEYYDIALLALKLVKENSEIRNEIKDNLNEILIDEYQDTSDIQEEFISYIASNNVYMVGDIKQSIYRFRNANPYIFKNKYDNYATGNGGIKIDLNKNFRSREEVISGINSLFNHIMDDEIGGANYTKSHQMIFGNNTYNEKGFNNQNNDYEVYTYEKMDVYKKEEIEAFIIAKDIKEKIDNKYLVFDKETNLNREIKYSDITILIDNSKHFELFKKILEYKGIPTSIMKSGNLLDGDLIILIKNIINLIIKVKEGSFDTEFKYLFTSLARSFIFEIDDNTILDYFINNNYYESDVYMIAKDISDNIDNTPLDTIIDLIIEKYDLYNKLILVGEYEENILKLDKLKEIIDNLINLNYDIYDFNNYLNDIVENNIKIEYQASDVNENSVKIMTIHASKGLEFSICYFACMFNKFNIREAINKYSYDNDYGIIIPSKKDFLNNTIYHTLSYKAYVKENIGERIRLFYVALTRAKEKMIFLLPNKEKDTIITDVIDSDIRKKYTSLADILYSLTTLIKENYKSIDLDSINLTKDYNSLASGNFEDKIEKVGTIIDVEDINIEEKEKDSSKFSKNSIHLITEDEENKLSLGRRVHELLEMTDFNSPNYENLDKEDASVIKSFLKEVDITGNINIYKEYEFIYEENDINYHGIIDLMIEYDDYIKIIDYKLMNTNDPAYLKQLNGYKKYIEKVFSKKAQIYLYSITLKKLTKL